MDENTKKQIETLAKVFDTNKIVSSSDIVAVLKGLKSILDTYKEETIALNNETADYIKNAIGTIQDKHNELLDVADEVIETKKNTLNEQVIDVKNEVSNEVEQINSKINEVKSLLLEVKKIKATPGKDGLDGESVDFNQVVSEVLSKIKLPEYELFNLEEKGEQIVNEINSLPLEEEYQIDAKHIKNIPVTMATAGPHYLAGDNITIEGNVISATGGGSSLTVQDIDGNPTATNVNTIKFTNGSVTDDGAGVVTVTTGSGGGGDVSSNTATSVDSEIALFSGTGGKTIKRSTGTGVAHLTSGVLSASNVVTADITDANVTLAKMADVATATVFYRKTAGTGVPEVQTLATLKTDLGLSGTNTGDQTSVSGNAGTATVLQTARTIGTLTGDATSAGSSFDGSANNTNVLTLATVNANVGSFGSATTSPTYTVNAKGLITAASNVTITPAVGSITGLGTGVGTALAVNIGSAGAPVLFNGAGGTPTSLTLTSATGLPLSTGVTGDLPFANFVQATAASKLVGRGSASGAGDFEEITIGSGLTMTGTTLSASGGGGGGTEVITDSLSSQQDNYSITGVTTDAGTTTILRITPTTSFILTGISSTSYGNGKRIVIENVTSYSGSGARMILIENESGDSTAANRFTYPQNGAPLMLLPGDKVEFIYNTTTSRFEFLSSTSFGGGLGQQFDFAYDAFGYVNGLLTQTVSGGSIATSTSGVTTSGLKPIGTMQVSTSTGTADRAFYALRDGSLQGAYGSAVSLIRAGNFSALSDGTNTYNVDFGWIDGMAATSNTDAVCWTYSSAVSGDFLTRTTANNVTTETTITGFTAATNTMPYFGIFCNGNWTNIEFFYSANGKDWTFSATAHIANIPTGTSRLFGWGTGIRKSAGTTTRTYEVDLMATRYMTNRGA